MPNLIPFYKVGACPQQTGLRPLTQQHSQGRNLPLDATADARFLLIIIDLLVKLKKNNLLQNASCK